MSLFKNEFVKVLLPALILYATVIVYQGYYYGKGDQSQILPVLYAQDHPGSYTQDHYVQSYLEAGFNERTFFHFLLRRLGYESPILVFLWHALSGIALIAAWISIAAIFIKSRYLQWTSIAVLLILGFHTSAGSNELYYPELIPSLPAKAFASWALFFWLKNKFSLWSILLIASTLIQPLVGLQLFLITLLAVMIEYFRSDKLHHLPWKPIVLYLIFSVPWIIALAINNGGQTNPSLFFEIIKFRLSHHFFASHFDIPDLLIALFLSFTVWIFYKGRLRWLVIMVWTGLLIYETGVELLELPFFLNAQWWKTTIWVEGLAFIAIGAFLEKSILQGKLIKNILPWAPVTLILLVLVYRFGMNKSTPDYMPPLSGKTKDDVDISQKAGELTSSDAVFLIPADLSAFRWYSKRSTYVDYKAMLHQEKFLFEWNQRIRQIYKPGPGIANLNNDLWSLKDPTEISSWNRYGITHIISRAKSLGSLQPVFSNKTYSIYRLPKVLD